MDRRSFLKLSGLAAATTLVGCASGPAAARVRPITRGPKFHWRGYYDKLPAYMQDIFSLTQRTVKGDEEEVVLQALEFWCTVAEEELDREGVS